MEEFEAEAMGAEETAKPSKLEWLPFAVFPLLAFLYFFVASPGGVLSRFCYFIGLSLIPGLIWRLTGRSSWNVHRICFAAGLITFVLDNPDLRPDRNTLTKMRDNWFTVAIGFFISFTQPVWGMLRTHRLLTDSGVVISKYDSLKLCLSGNFFNIFLPGSTGGDAYRVYAITHGYKTKLGPAIASITLDRFLGLPSLIMVVLLGMLLDYQFFLSNRILSSLIPFISGAAAVCVALVVYLGMAGKARRRQDWTKPFESPDGKRPNWFKRTHALIATNVKSPATLPLALFYGFLSHLACIASCIYFAVALGVQGVPILRYFLIVPMTMTINSIPGAPGGVGQGELAMATLLDMASPNMGNAQEGVIIMLLFRLSNMVLGLIGGLYYAFGKMDFSGVDHVSQGLTRIISRASASCRLPKRISQRYEKAKSDSVRLLFEQSQKTEANPPETPRTDGET
ncbi:MAG: flippase-like domain-containing protein [Planctomycetaceae bacterium]|nr:flippase-like domain-containing protein [Planctomycetaceae bacterium]